MNEAKKRVIQYLIDDGCERSEQCTDEPDMDFWCHNCLVDHAIREQEQTIKDLVAAGRLLLDHVSGPTHKGEAELEEAIAKAKEGDHG